MLSCLQTSRRLMKSANSSRRSSPEHTLRQLLELDDEMLLRVGAGMKRGIWFGTAVFDGAQESEIKALLASAGLPSSEKPRCSTA